MKTYILLLHFLTFSLFLIGQEQQFVEFTDAPVDPTLVFSQRLRLQLSTYIVNKTSVYFQKNDSVRITVNADPASFRDVNSVFGLDKNGVYLRGKFIKTDTTGFELIGTIYDQQAENEHIFVWTTKNRLFFDYTEIKAGIDIASFESMAPNPSFANKFTISSPYFRDKNFIYFKNKKIPGSDPRSAACISSTTLYDKNHLYINGEIALFEGDTIRPVNDALAKTATVVLTIKDLVAQPDMDAATIRRLSATYSLDKNSVYFHEKKTPILAENLGRVKVWDQIESHYISDGYSVYGGANTPVLDIDVPTFGVLPSSNYYSDKNGIYQRKFYRDLGPKGEMSTDKFAFNYQDTVSNKNAYASSTYILYMNQVYRLKDRTYFHNLTQKQIEDIRSGELPVNALFDSIDSTFAKTRAFDKRLYELNGKIYWKRDEIMADAATFRWNGLCYQDKSYFYEYFPSARSKAPPKPYKSLDPKSTRIINGFLTDKSYLYVGRYKVLKNINLELLAVFRGYRSWCGTQGFSKETIYLFKNSEGYWLIETRGDPARYAAIGRLGTTLPPEMKKKFNWL